MIDQPVTKHKKHLNTWILLTVLFVCSIIIVFKWDWVHARYSHIIHDHFKSGDKLYAKPGLFDRKSTMTSLFVGRLIRPINETDIDLMNISAEQKALRKKKLNPSLKEYLISTNCYFDKNRLIEAKSAFIGTYIEHAFLPFNFGDASGEDSFYAITPNKSSLTDLSFDFKMPSNYVWSNHNFYVFEESIVNNEFQSFVK
jgi:hypothetical protein